MTLDTTVFVIGETDAHKLFKYCQDLLSPTAVQIFTDEPRTYGDRGIHRIGNELGQGLCALMDVAYRPGGALRTPEQAAAHEDCNVPGYEYYDALEPDCDGSDHYPACWAEVSFDTTYGYRGDNGYGCGDLHAELVGKLGRWLDEQGVAWGWHNEFTGDIHVGPDRYERLADLGRGGAQAAAWFRTVALPAIVAEIESRPTS